MTLENGGSDGEQLGDMLHRALIVEVRSPSDCGLKNLCLCVMA